LESLLGLLTPCARQNEGRFVSVWPADATSVPDVTSFAAVMLVFPSKVSDVKPEQETPLFASRSRAWAAVPINTAAAQPRRVQARNPGRPTTIMFMAESPPVRALVK
jgi:hypothetical protein